MSKKDWETDGTRNGFKIYCPVNCWDEEDCPYADNGICHIADPVKDCEDFAMVWGSWDEWDTADDGEPDASDSLGK